MSNRSAKTKMTTLKAKHILTVLESLAKILGVLAVFTTPLAYVFNQRIAAFASLSIACIVGTAYAVWILGSRVSASSSAILGLADKKPRVYRFTLVQRRLAALAIIVQVSLLVSLAVVLIRESHRFETLQPATAGESLVVIFTLKRAEGVQDVTESIVNLLRQQLEGGPNAGIVASVSRWRVERSQRMLDPSDAREQGQKLGSLFVVSGSNDGSGLNLSIAITDPAFQIRNNAISDMGLRLDSSPISMSVAKDEIQSQLIPLAIFLKGVQLYVSGDFNGAAQHCGRVIDSSTNVLLKARAHYVRGICHVNLQALDQAENDYQSALNAGLDIPAVHWRRAELFLSLSRMPDVVNTEMETALKQSGYSAASYYICGVLTFESMLRIPYVYKEQPEDFARADDYLRVSFEKDPTQVTPVMTRLALHSRYSKFLGRDTEKEVTAILEEAIRHSPASAQLKLRLARVKLDFGHATEAVSLLEADMTNTDRPEEFMLGLGAAYEKTGDKVNAAKYFNMFLEKAPAREGMWWTRANVKAQIARIDGSGEQGLFEELSATEAAVRKRKFLDVSRAWVGKIWNKSFMGERSTEDLLLFFLTEADVIPRIRDRQSAVEVMHALLDDDNVRISNEDAPLWCDTGLWAGGFMVFSVSDTSNVEGVYLGPGSDGRVTTMKDSIIGTEFFYKCSRISMNRKLAFSGD